MVNVEVRAAAATLEERYGVTLVAIFGTCYGGGRALEASTGWVLPLTSRAVMVRSDVDDNNVREVD